MGEVYRKFRLSVNGHLQGFGLILPVKKDSTFEELIQQFKILAFNVFISLGMEEAATLIMKIHLHNHEKKHPYDYAHNEPIWLCDMDLCKLSLDES